ncbi:ComF family protein [Actinocatenispora thailandica]|nr:ComF family protein [Actinocatenispora thailandica]
MRDVLVDLVELVFPADCPGCGAAGPAAPLCLRCGAALRAATAGPTAPDPAPPGLPPCHALGAYQGMLRELILSYKERGRLGLAGPLGRALAVALRAAVAGRAGGDSGAVTLVPVPATAAAVRARHGDHTLRLARSAARWLGRDGTAAVVRRPLLARPRGADSTELTAAARIARSDQAFRLRPGAGRLARCDPVVLLDDLITTGATLAGAARLLRAAGVPVAAAVTLAATRRHQRPAATHSTW